MVKIIIFDVMGVVFTEGDDVENLLIPYIRSLKSDVDKQEIKKLYISTSLGKLTSHEFWQLAGFEETDISETEQNYLEKSFSLDPGFLPCAKALKDRYGIALLSNDVSEWSRFLRKHYDIEPLIDAAFISGDLGVRKPDPEIYKIVLEELGKEPGECVFIDDDPERVGIARELGINSILFNRVGHEYNDMQVESFEQLKELLL